VVGYFYSLKRLKRIKATAPKYLYENFYGVPNQVLFISSLKYKQTYIDYYRSVSKGDSNKYILFPIQTFPVNDPVYIISYTKDSQLVKVLSLFDRGKYFGGSYNEGYVLPEFLHNVKTASE
jgi:hypothetical protein